MIRYRVRCGGGHQFDGWFRNMAAFDQQAAGGLIVCPSCGSSDVDKAPMAPNLALATRSSDAARPDSTLPSATFPRIDCIEGLRAIRRALLENSEHVGPRFAAEARDIDSGAAKARGIHGEATVEEARSLLQDGIAVFALPPLPEDHH